MSMNWLIVGYVGLTPTVGCRRSRRRAIRALRAELAVAEDAVFAVARNVMAGPGGRPLSRRGGAASIVSGQCARLWPQWWTSSSVSEMVYFFYSSTQSV